MKLFKRLSIEENKMLLTLPAYISMLAANRDGKMDDEEKSSVIKLAHIKTFSCDPLLGKYFKEVGQVFEINIEHLDKTLPKDKGNRDAVINIEILKLEKIVKKLEDEYASTMYNCMKSFKAHVEKAHNSVVTNFILPLSLPGIPE